MKVKEILEMNDDELREIMTEEEWDRMLNLGFKYAWELLDLLQESARLGGQGPEEEHITVSAYLDYLEDMKNND